MLYKKNNAEKHVAKIVLKYMYNKSSFVLLMQKI